MHTIRGTDIVMDDVFINYPYVTNDSISLQYYPLPIEL